jgi:hypothetical protein
MSAEQSSDMVLETVARALDPEAFDESGGDRNTLLRHRKGQREARQKAGIALEASHHEELMDVLVAADAALREAGAGYAVRKDIYNLLAKIGGHA